MTIARVNHGGIFKFATIDESIFDAGSEHIFELIATAAQAHSVNYNNLQSQTVKIAVNINKNGLTAKHDKIIPTSDETNDLEEAELNSDPLVTSGRRRL